MTGVRIMEQENRILNNNLLRLVKLAGDSDRPSETFTHGLVDEALGQLRQGRAGGEREMAMKTNWIKCVAWAAVILLIAGLGFNLLIPKLYKGEMALEKMVTTGEPSNTSKAAMVPIPLILPNPMFIGTPANIEGVTNIEKPLGKDRPPFYSPAGTTNVAAGKPVSGSDEDPVYGELAMVTDGDKEATDGSYVDLAPFVQYVTIDLEAEHEIYAIVAWHYHQHARVYFDVIVQISNDQDFIEATTVFNNDIDNSAGMGVGGDMHYVETNEGKLIDAKGRRGRYVRLYSNGNSDDELNHYIEVQVFGKALSN